MACNFNKCHKDCLYWIYPLIILGLIVVALVRDEHNSGYDAFTGADYNAEYSLAIKKSVRKADSLRTKEFIDSTAIIYATK